MRGRADCGWLPFVDSVFFERSSFLGRGRELGWLGDCGSFLITIFGAPGPEDRGGPAGEDLDDVACPLGLLLPERWAGATLALALADADGFFAVGEALGGAAAEELVAISEEAKEGRS